MHERISTEEFRLVSPTPGSVCRSEGHTTYPEECDRASQLSLASMTHDSYGRLAPTTMVGSNALSTLSRRGAGRLWLGGVLPLLL